MDLKLYKAGSTSPALFNVSALANDFVESGHGWDAMTGEKPLMMCMCAWLADDSDGMGSYWDDDDPALLALYRVLVKRQERALREMYGNEEAC